MNDERYQVIIIGAGIGGLVSGCLLALAKKKVLIVEKNDVPGGYCTSFKQFGLHFDTCAHSLGDLSKQGKLFAILNKIGVLEKVKRVRYDPGDIIVTEDFEVCF
ncbi:MAG TPA: NAD(P)-binding protein, partial [Candidatus Omnitrophota bacterium]|nr:NAD(P)-binding protein [Candidatus Omnitrophota bacterium]